MPPLLLYPSAKPDNARNLAAIFSSYQALVSAITSGHHHRVNEHQVPDFTLLFTKQAGVYIVFVFLNVQAVKSVTIAFQSAVEGFNRLPGGAGLTVFRSRSGTHFLSAQTGLTGYSESHLLKLALPTGSAHTTRQPYKPPVPRQPASILDRPQQAAGN